MSKKATWQRNMRAAWRDTLVLLRQFAWPLLLFVAVLVGGGLLYDALAAIAGQPVDSPVESIYGVLEMIFLQPLGEFPDVWYLQLFYFVMPIVGIGILAFGLAIYLFNWDSRNAARRGHPLLALLADHGYADVRPVVAAQESLLFALPNELRRDLKARKGVEAASERHDGSYADHSLH